MILKIKHHEKEKKHFHNVRNGRVQLKNYGYDNQSYQKLTFIYDIIDRGFIFTKQGARGQYACFCAPNFVSF